MITLNEVRRHDRIKIERILQQLKNGSAVAVFLMDGGWKSEEINKGKIRYTRTTCVVSDADLLGVYKTNQRTTLSDVKKIILQDLLDCEVLAIKGHK